MVRLIGMEKIKLVLWVKLIYKLMDKFLQTTHLSEILENSYKEPIVIFKYSSECGSSSVLASELRKNIIEQKLIHPVYLVTVQTHIALSEKISDLFQIKHESPQIIILNKGKVTYTAHHREIDIRNFIFQ